MYDHKFLYEIFVGEQEKNSCVLDHPLLPALATVIIYQQFKKPIFDSGKINRQIYLQINTTINRFILYFQNSWVCCSKNSFTTLCTFSSVWKRLPFNATFRDSKMWQTQGDKSIFTWCSYLFLSLLWQHVTVHCREAEWHHVKTSFDVFVLFLDGACSKFHYTAFHDLVTKKKEKKKAYNEGNWGYWSIGPIVPNYHLEIFTFYTIEKRR